MQSMNISLPDPLKQFVDGQIAQGRYSSVSEYMRELIRADERRKAEDLLEAKLLEGLNSQETRTDAGRLERYSKRSSGQVGRPKEFALMPKVCQH